MDIVYINKHYVRPLSVYLITLQVNIVTSQLC